MAMAHAHRHDDVEVNLTETGTLHYLFGGEEVHIGPGSVAAFWAARPHQLVAADPAADVRWVTVPLPTFMSWNLPEPFVTALLLGRAVSTAWADRAWEAGMLDRWSRDLDSGSAYLRTTTEIEMQAWTRRLAYVTGLENWPDRSSATGSPADGTVGKATAMAGFIAEHYTEPIGVEQIAAVVHLHPRYAMTLFRRVVGITLLRYLTQFRIAEAQRLLLTTDLPTADVAHAAGFGSQSQFYQAFSAACGLPPAAYRRAIGERPGPSNR